MYFSIDTGYSAIIGYDTLIACFGD